MQPPDPNPLSVAALERIDEACTRFEQLWRNEPRPNLGDFLTGIGEERRALLRELLKVEIEYRHKHGEQPSAEECQQRFPDDDGAAVFESILREREQEQAAEIQRLSHSLSAQRPPGGFASLSPQTITFQRYRIERVLGQGAFGIVYLAEDRELHRFVALKVAHHPGRLRGDAFLAEARVLASLDHPAIIPVYDVGRADERSYIVTKWIEGSNLSERLRQGLPAHRQSAGWMTWIARGLQTAHDKGIVHRDVKPSNILIDTAGKAYVGDFGLALSEEHFGSGPRLLGTPAYMSPEQARGDGHRVDARSDVFSLGVVLYEMLTGRPPFQAETVSKTLKHVVELDPVAPVRLNPNVGRDLDTICLKCVEKTPEKRYASAGALAEDLQRYLDNRAILARPAGPTGKLVRWSRRSPAVAVSLAGTLAVFLAAFLIVSWSYFRAEVARENETLQKQEAERREKGERWERYRSNLVAAASALQLNNVAAARDALDAAPPEHRNWEWHHFHQQLDTAAVALPGGSNRSIIRFSSNADSAVVFDAAEQPRLFDIRSRREIGPVATAFRSRDGDLSPDGAALAVVKNNTIEIWEIANNRQRAIVQSPDRKLSSPLFSPDGRHLVASADDDRLRAWDTVTGKELFVLNGQGGAPEQRTFSADGRLLASAGANDRTVRLWEPHTGRPIAVLAGHDETVKAMLFSPSGDRILTCEGYPSDVLRLWDVSTGRLLGVLRGHENEVMTLAFSPDGTRIATGSFDQTIRLWDGATGKALTTIRGHKGWVWSLVFNADGKRLASASQDQTVRLWDAVSGESVAVLLGDAAPIHYVRFSSDAATLISATENGTVRLRDVQAAERAGKLKGHTSFVYDGAFSPDGSRVASASWDGTVRLWDPTSGAPLALLRNPKKTFITGVAFQPIGDLLASVGREDSLRLWNVNSGIEVGRVTAQPNAFSDARPAFSRQSGFLACGCTDRAVHIWRISPSRPGPVGSVQSDEVAVLGGHPDAVTDVVFGPEDAWLASATSGGHASVRIWDLSRNELIHLLEGHAGSINALALDHNGKWLASGSEDGTVRLWDTSTWQQEAVLTQGTTTYGMAFSPDGTRLACACANNTIRLWDVLTHQAVCDLHGHDAYVHQVAFSPDGTRLVSASGDFTLRVWDSLSSQERAALEKTAGKR